MKYLSILILSISLVIGSLKIGESQKGTQGTKSVSKIGQFSLRNDGEDLMKPIGTPIPSLPEVKEEVKKVEKKEIPEEELYPKIPKPAFKPQEVKKEEVIEKEERLGLKVSESAEELPKIVARAKIPPKPEVEQVMPEESPYYLKLSPGGEPLPKPEIKKPVIPPTEKPIIAKVEEEKEIIPIVPTEPVPPTELAPEKPKFAFQRINPILRWGIILFGILTLILIILLRYLWRQRELSSLAEIGEVPMERLAKYKSLMEDVKELQSGYRGLEKAIESVEKNLTPLTSLKGLTIEEVTRDTSKEILKPIESGIKELQTTCQGLEKMFGEFDKRFAPLDALKGLSIKELAQQTSMEIYKPLENEFKKIQISNERMMSELEEKIDKKIEPINKKTKNLEKAMSDIDSRLTMIDSMISSLPKGEAAIPKPVIRTEEVKSTTFKDKKNREILHNQIYKLSDEGLSIDEIAQRTKLGKGEVRLILGLRKK